MKKATTFGLWLVALVCTAANAAPIAYTFQFTPSSGPQPTGQFTYDALAALDSRFSAFTVNSAGLVVDFTSIAKLEIPDSVGGCGVPRSSAVLFQYLDGLCGVRAYETFNFGGVLGAVELSAAAPPGFSQLGAGVSAPGAGVFTIRRASTTPGVPEPSTVWLTLCALGAVAAAGKRPS